MLNHCLPAHSIPDGLKKKRIAAATVARAIVDSLLQRNPQADIILMGDFNDEPGDRSLKETLGSSFSREQVLSEPDTYLYNCWDGHDGEGSYRYRGHWEQIDQMLVSSGMLQKSGLRLDSKPFSCFAYPPCSRRTANTHGGLMRRENTAGIFRPPALLLKVRTSPEQEYQLR